MTTPKITVVMSTFNRENFLPKSIESVLRQTYRDFEFIIIDDGSSDASVDVIHSYKDERIRLIRNEKNLGIVRSVNNGIHLAKGEYIVRMDSDDICLAHRFKRQVDFMESHPAVVVCGSWVVTFGRQRELWRYPVGHDEIFCHLLFDSTLAQSSTILRKSFLKEQAIYYDENFSIAEDYDLWTRVAQHKGRLANIPEELLKYRLHPENIATKEKQRMIILADQIRKRQLLNLGLTISKEDVDVHSKIARGLPDCSKEFFKDAENWLLKILDANDEKQIYEKEALKKVLTSKWLHLCGYASVLGRGAFMIFRRSRLSRLARIGLTDYIQFLIKCGIKYKRSTH